MIKTQAEITMLPNEPEQRPDAGQRRACASLLEYEPALVNPPVVVPELRAGLLLLDPVLVVQRLPSAGHDEAGLLDQGVAGLPGERWGRVGHLLQWGRAGGRGEGNGQEEGEEKHVAGRKVSMWRTGTGHGELYMPVGERGACCVLFTDNINEMLTLEGKGAPFRSEVGFVSAQVWRRYRSGRCPASPELMVTSVLRKAGVMIKAGAVVRVDPASEPPLHALSECVVRHTMR